MPDRQCCSLERRFDSKVARDDLRDYLRQGADRSTALLIGALRDKGVAGRTLLDIGGGVGAIQFELLEAGLASSTDVDISGAYLDVAQREAASRGYADRTVFRRGDFVAVAGVIGPADIVTLDRVICCYPDLDGLARKAAIRTRERLGIVHPHDRWYLRLGAAFINIVGRPFGAARFYVHPTPLLESILRSAGLELEWSRGTRLWRVAVYRRTSAGSG